MFEKLTRANEIYLAKTPEMIQHLSLKNSTEKTLWISLSPYVSALSVYIIQFHFLGIMFY